MVVMAARTQKATISEVTRRDITDRLVADHVAWWGRLGEVDFLSRIWPLEQMPSTDSRFRDAARDIHQHRINNYDWDDDWIFGDPRFELRRGPDEIFVRFLCEMLHPIVRPDTADVESLLAFFNECLARDDWELVETSQLSGKPVLEGRRRTGLKSPSTALALDGYGHLHDPSVIRDQLARIDRGLRRDPAEAIASSKELVETVCKTILDDYGIAYARRNELLDLYKKVADVLKLNAEAVPDSAKGSRAAQQTLRTLVTTIQSLAELRNELGLGHGPTRRSPALTRHGRLAFNAAIAVVEFLLDTWHVRRAGS
jgi:hypothetical protein